MLIEKSRLAPHGYRLGLLCLDLERVVERREGRAVDVATGATLDVKLTIGIDDAAVADRVR
ncbi:MAG: hypothetical protein GY949_20435, partial [Gammaproteobacteria bacterium]|nr:hypothetical protein [Gammaproteobacteria bacterium]